MYNLKRGGGTYKGLIGECMFKLTRRCLIVTKFFNKKKYFEIFGDRFSKKEYNFLDKNWFSIDAIEIDYTKTPRKIVLFEIKTLNEYYARKSNWIPSLTFSTYKIYNEALRSGFDVKFAIVWLKDNWEYDVEIVDFKNLDYYVDKPKKYDKDSGYFL